MTTKTRFKIKKSHAKATIITFIKNTTKEKKECRQSAIIKHLENELGVSSRSTRRYLAELEEAGKLIYYKDHKRTAWRLSETEPKEEPVIKSKSTKKNVKKSVLVTEKNTKKQNAKKVSKSTSQSVKMTAYKMWKNNKTLTAKELHTNYFSNECKLNTMRFWVSMWKNNKQIPTR